jgi:hypothetical protein
MPTYDYKSLTSLNKIGNKYNASQHCQALNKRTQLQHSTFVTEQNRMGLQYSIGIAEQNRTQIQYSIVITEQNRAQNTILACNQWRK